MPPRWYSIEFRRSENGGMRVTVPVVDRRVSPPELRTSSVVKSSHGRRRDSDPAASPTTQDPDDSVIDSRMAVAPDEAPVRTVPMDGSRMPSEKSRVMRGDNRQVWMSPRIISASRAARSEESDAAFG